jgi:hypothetical protein
LDCCKGIFGDSSGAPNSLPERENKTSGTSVTLHNFLPMGCLCDDDIYGQDPDFFDAILTFVTAPDDALLRADERRYQRQHPRDRHYSQ